MTTTHAPIVKNSEARIFVGVPLIEHQVDGRLTQLKTLSGGGTNQTLAPHSKTCCGNGFQGLRRSFAVASNRSASITGRRECGIVVGSCRDLRNLFRVTTCRRRRARMTARLIRLPADHR